NEIEPEAGIERIGERLQTLAKQTLDDLRIAYRPAGFRRHPPHNPVGAEEHRFHFARATLTLLHPFGKRLSQRIERGEDCLVVADGLGEAMLRHELRKLVARRNRLLSTAERAVQDRESTGTEARCKFAARAAHDLLNRLEPRTAERVNGLGIQMQ